VAQVAFSFHMPGGPAAREPQPPLAGRDALWIVSIIQESDLACLRPLLETIEPRSEDLITNWYEAYSYQFNDSRSLPEPEFRQIFGSSMRRTVRALIEHRLGDYVTEVRRLGETLARRAVPFQEIAAMHMYQAMGVRASSQSDVAAGEIFTVYEKLNWVRMTVLGEAYFRYWNAESGVRISNLEREAAKIPAEKRTQFHGLIGATSVMRELYRRIEAAGRTRGTVLIVGESGSGKELVARAIHECGAEPGASFVALNCAALPTHLIESELFGYRRGAFSGATADYPGLFRAADGGTLFLDEVTEMSPETQSKLLRVVQERMVRPVGSTREIPVDVRLVASTNRDPNAAVTAGRLRLDLYYRLQASVVQVPPLRARTSDIPLLAEHFVRIFNERSSHRTTVLGLEPAALEALKRHNWPGNVRELSNVIEGAFTFGSAPLLQVEDLALPTIIPSAPRMVPLPGFAQQASPAAEGTERDLIRRALEKTGGNKSRAATLLGISRKKLYSRMGRYELF
jgi:DNA-binding NtrC family response regulator